LQQPINNENSLGKKLYELRKQHNISQNKLADMLGVSGFSYNRWETGKGKPLAENLEKIAKYYKINVNYFDDNEKVIDNNPTNTTNLQQPINNENSLGKKLYELRKQHNLSQNKLADMLGVSGFAYYRWETGKGKPLAENLEKIAKYYNIDVNYFEDNDDNDDNDDNEEVNVDNNNVRVEKEIPTNNIQPVSVPNLQPSAEMMKIIDEVLQKQKQISKLLESQFMLMMNLLKK
jgi:transcriptional regulator with XRE-family HTH domain